MPDPIVADQPPPTPTPGRPIWDLVIDDMRDRDRVGRERYGTPLQVGNGRDPLVDAYQEALDLAVYLRQAIEERTAGEIRYVERIAALESFLRDIDRRGGLGGRTHDAIKALLAERLA